MNPESLAPETRILPLDQSPFKVMKSKIKNCSLVSCFRIKNRRFIVFTKELGFVLYPYSIIGFPKIIESTVLKNINLGKKLGISHLLIFSQQNFFFFLTLIKTGFGPFISFRILNFSLGKEIQPSLDHKNLKDLSPILLLNNFFEDKISLTLKEALREIFPIEESQQILAKKSLKIVLIDFNKQNNTIDFRCYKVKGNLVLFPRKLRKKKTRNIDKKILSKEFVENSLKLKIGSRIKENTLNLIRIEEIGPRFSAKVCEIFSKILI